MVKGPVHDKYERLLDRLIAAVAAEMGVTLRALGETTWIRPAIERGIEADQCYVFDPAKIAAVTDALSRDINDVAEYSNPDLAVEVGISSPQADRPGIYAALQVPELWRFDGADLSIAHLGPAGYIGAGASRWLPLTAAEVTHWLVEEDTRDPAVWEDRVRAWARAELTGRQR